MPATRLVTKLLATSTVTDIVIAKIYPVRVRQGTGLPYVTYQVISDTPVNVAAGTTASGFCRIQIDCWASGYTGAQTLADAVRTAINGWSVVDGSQPSIGMCHLLMSTDMTEPPDPGQNTATHRVSQDYQLDYATA